MALKLIYLIMKEMNIVYYDKILIKKLIKL